MEPKMLCLFIHTRHLSGLLCFLPRETWATCGCAVHGRWHSSWATLRRWKAGSYLRNEHEKVEWENSLRVECLHTQPLLPFCCEDYVLLVTKRIKRPNQGKLWGCWGRRPAGFQRVDFQSYPLSSRLSMCRFDKRPQEAKLWRELHGLLCAWPYSLSSSQREGEVLEVLRGGNPVAMGLDLVSRQPGFKSYLCRLLHHLWEATWSLCFV